MSTPYSLTHIYKDSGSDRTAMKSTSEPLTIGYSETEESVKQQSVAYHKCGIAFLGECTDNMVRQISCIGIADDKMKTHHVKSHEQ